VASAGRAGPPGAAPPSLRLRPVRGDDVELLERWRADPEALGRFGIWLLPGHRGRGHGSEAQRQLAAYLFAHTPVERVEASTDVDNATEQRALEKAGFTREGVLRHAQFREGGFHDLVLYSKLRGE
jgi:ribosomal protein S18 acetylase RimI-like enzyme